ncbi:ATP-binding protein [Nonomuraea sediminis]|uniref:ATP-binding protein n=1 Tax=Nonomuraea sediminis TaxID=2835864 RepID=UPI001BDBE64B|nr:LuxR family transcriptional regulator [Nonomuraea sediminis]
MKLYGRAAEQETVGRLLNAGPGALVVRGEAGIGKSALLEHAAIDFPGRMLRVNGVESEAELPFAALHLLLRPVLDRIDALPRQQADALTSALGMGAARPGDRFLIGLATLSLLDELSADGPLLCVVDDAQWLDQESADALLFAVRRLHAEPVVFLFAARDEGGSFPAPGVPELWLAGLDPEAAGQLLAESSAGLALAVREQIVAEAQGNPLALLELPRTLTAEQRVGGFTPMSLGGAEPVSSRVLAGFRARIEALPAASRRCVLVAALDDRRALDTLSRALGDLDASLADFAPAERAGLLQVTTAGVAFRHPLVATAARLAGDVAQRMAAHRALAGAVDDDRRAWHLAAVTTGPDELVARELEAVAARARRRGGQAAVSTAYERAAELSSDSPSAARRLAAAASAAGAAGLAARAADLAARAERRINDLSGTAVIADLALVRATLAFEADRPLEAIRLLHDTVVTLGDRDPAATLSMLGLATVYTWMSSAHPEQVELARRTEELTPSAGDGRILALNQAVRRLLEGDVAAAVLVPDGLGRDEQLPFELRVLAAYLGLACGGHRTMLEDATRLVEDCRSTGRIGRLSQALRVLAAAQVVSGRHPAARASVEEGLRVAMDLGQSQWGSYLTGLAAWLAGVAGAEEECLAMAARSAGQGGDEVRLLGLGWATYARCVLDLGLGRYESALARLDRAIDGPAGHALVWLHAYPDYVEAAVRAGDPGRSERALARFAAWAKVIKQPWATAVLLRCRALLADGDEAAELYERALALHQRSDQPFDQARTELLYGEWLRRHQRRAEARPHLQVALETFDRLGARPWAERAATELRAAGASQRDRPHDSDPLAALTPQELHVVRLAATGASNREIGAQLFLSPRTVAYHLYKAFPKLGITSRAELAKYVMT